MKILEKSFELFELSFTTINQARDSAIKTLLNHHLLRPYVEKYSANSITKFRGFLTFCVAVFLFDHWLLGGYTADFTHHARVNLAIMVGIIGFLDLVDGSWARKRKELDFEDGDIGIKLDPFWDKVLTSSFFVFYFFLLTSSQQILIGTAIIGDAIATYCRNFAAKKNIAVPANSFGKLKTMFQIATILYLIAAFPRAGDALLILMTIALTLGMISIILNARIVYYHLKADQAAKAEIFDQVTK